MTDTVVCDCNDDVPTGLTPWPEGFDVDRDRDRRPARITLQGHDVSTSAVQGSVVDGWVLLVRRDDHGNPVWHGDHFAMDIRYGRVTLEKP